MHDKNTHNLINLQQVKQIMHKQQRFGGGLEYSTANTTRYLKNVSLVLLIIVLLTLQVVMLERHYKRHGNFTPTKLLNRFHENEVPHDYFDYQDFDTNGESNQESQEQKHQLNLKLKSASSGGEIFNK